MWVIGGSRTTPKGGLQGLWGVPYPQKEGGIDGVPKGRRMGSLRKEGGIDALSKEEELMHSLIHVVAKACL